MTFFGTFFWKTTDMLDPATLKAVYLDTGLYRRILDQQFKLIATYLNNITFGSRDIVVFDIDEVCLSSLMHVAPEYACEHSDATDTVIIEECMQVFRVLEHKGAGYAFVTGRKERIRAETRDDLTRVGLGEYVALYMCPGEYGKSVACFKAVCREDLVSSGYTIVACIGDQPGDMQGPHTGMPFLIFNPFYSAT